MAIDKETQEVRVDMEDELVKATALTHAGKLVHPGFGGANDKGDA